MKPRAAPADAPVKIPRNPAATWLDDRRPSRSLVSRVRRHVARTNEPVIVRRYAHTDVALVPLWEWRWLKGIEAAIQAGEIDASEFLASMQESNDDSEAAPV